MDDQLQNIDILINSLKLSNFSRTCSNGVNSSTSAIRHQSLKNQIIQRDIVIQSLRRYQKKFLKQKNLPEDTVELIHQMKSEYDSLINEQAKSFLKEKHDLEASYMNEINRLRSLIETHRESLLFEKLPILTIEQYNELSTAPHSNISLEQFIAMQLYELKRDEKIKIQNISDLYAELVLDHDKIKKELEITKQKLLAESALRASLESQISKLSVPIELPKIPDSNDDIYKKYQDLQNQLKDMTSSYNGAIARSDLLLERLNANNKQLEAYSLRFRDAQKEIASLKSQLSTTNNELIQQQKIIERRDKELQELKQRHNDLLIKTLENTKV